MKNFIQDIFTKNTLIKDIRGNMAAIFAVTLMMLLAGVGAAIDISSMQSKRQKYQAYADAAVLAAAASGESNVKKLNKIARKTVKGNNFNKQKMKTKLTILADGTMHVEITTKHDMILMGMFGTDYKQIHVVAEAPPTSKEKLLNIALVLDVTGSMEGSRINDLKKAAKTLVNNISGGQDSETMFSVVPFAQYVKLPMRYKDKNWLNVEPSGQVCWDTIDYDKSVNCRGVGSVENLHVECDVTIWKEICQWYDWKGCVASRVSPWHKREHYGASKIQGFTLLGWCHTEMLPLTKDISEVKKTISNLSTAQDTYIPSGLMWGWRALTPGAPLTEANTPDYAKRTQALLLMTDGNNTRSLDGNGGYSYEGVYHWGTDKEEADDLTAELCESIKADGILIFTVAFEVSDSNTISLLKSCASDPAKFYDAANASQLKAAFADVGNGLGGDVRLSK